MPQPTLWSFVAYFLRLGALGFGGPVALANYMRRDLVEAAHRAQVQLARFDQAKIDRICEAMSRAALKDAARLGSLAVEETGFGVADASFT